MLNGLRRWQRAVRGIATEAQWKRIPPAAGARISWPLDAGMLRSTRVVWPSEYAWEPAKKWMDPLLHGIQALVPVTRETLPQSSEHVVLIRVYIEGQELVVAVDYADSAEVDREQVEKVALYFKMQFRNEGYEWPHVVPGGFVPADSMVYHAIPSLRKQRGEQRPRFDVYGRFGREFAQETRARAVELLSTQSLFRFEGSLARIRYSTYLQEIAAAKVCIDLPGNGAFCFRLVDYMAVGACIVGVEHSNRLPAPLVPGEHMAFVRPDLSDLVSVCGYYLEHTTEREKLCRNSRDYFDRYLHRDQLAAYYLSCCFRAVDSLYIPPVPTA